MIDLGTVKPGTTLYIPFATYDSNDPSASVTLTGLATTDIEIYKDGSTTQRASDSGYTLLDTDGIDFDTTTGIHGFSIDLSDNTTAGFYAAGSQYWVVVASVTVDAATINFIAATFRIGYPDAILNTTIATLSSQTSFTLTSGPAEADALNGCVVCIHDVASAVQLGFAVISDYAVTTKTVTLTAGVSFTAAATDNISIFPPSAARWLGAVAQTGDGTELTEAGGDGDHLTAINLPNQTMDITGNITGNLSGSVGSVTGAVGSVTGNVGGSVVGSVASVTGAVGSVTGNVGGNVSGSVGSVTGGLNTAAGTITTLDGLDTAQDTQHATTQAATTAIETDTQDIQSRLPAALVNSRMDSTIDATGMETGAIDAIWTRALTEAYRSTGATGTAAQLLYEILAHLGEFAISSTTKTTKKLDGSTTAKTYTLDDATSPTSITETT